MLPVPLVKSMKFTGVAGLLIVALTAQMPGSYTITAAWPGSATHFTTLGATTAQLLVQGVGGPVLTPQRGSVDGLTFLGHHSWATPLEVSQSHGRNNSGNLKVDVAHSQIMHVTFR